MATIESRRKLPLIGIVTLITSLAVIWLIWFSTTSLISAKLVDTSLQQISKQLTDIGNAHGMDAKLTYDKVDVKGWALNKHAVINNVGIDIMDKSGVYPIKWRIATEEATLSNDPNNRDNILLVFSKPVNLLQNEKVVKSLLLSEPLKYSFGQINVDGALAFHHNIILPTRIALMESNGAPEEALKNTDIQAGQEEQVVFSFAKSPYLNVISSGMQKINSISYDFSNLTVSKNNQNYITIGKWVSDFNEKPTDTLGHTSGNYILQMQDIVLHGKGNGKPYNIDVDTLFTADSADEKLPDQKVDEAKPADEKSDAAAESNAEAEMAKDIDEGPTENRDVVLKQFVISNPDFKFSASGNFSNVKGDPLPSGEVNIDIENLPQFLASDLISQENRPLVENVLAKVSGKPVAEQTQMSIPLKREKMGMFLIGKSNFEELTAIWLSGMMMMSTPPNEIPSISPGIQSPEEPVTEEPVTDLPGGDSVSMPATAPKL